MFITHVLRKTSEHLSRINYKRHNILHENAKRQTAYVKNLTKNKEVTSIISISFTINTFYHFKAFS